MSKINLGLDFEAIRHRIKEEMKGIKPSKWAKIVGVSRQIVTNVHSDNPTQPPSLQYIIAVARATNKSIEYYLYGNKYESKPIIFRVADPDGKESFNKRSLESLLSMAKEILESGMTYGASLEANIESFHEAVKTRQQFMELERRVAALEGKKEGVL